MAFQGGSFRDFADAITGQESGGRYGIANTQGSGAMGIVQTMPETTKALAARLGVAYRPDLMAGATPEAMAYQNQLGNASLQDDWKFGGGDPRRAAYHHFAGPNQGGWGPKTRQYGNDILGRMSRMGNR